MFQSFLSLKNYSLLGNLLLRLQCPNTMSCCTQRKGVQRRAWSSSVLELQGKICLWLVASNTSQRKVDLFSIWTNNATVWSVPSMRDSSLGLVTLKEEVWPCKTVKKTHSLITTVLPLKVRKCLFGTKFTHWIEWFTFSFVQAI